MEIEGMRLNTIVAALSLAVIAFPAFAEPKVGEAAPAFSGVDSNGQPVSLADYAGKTVVLEWSNHQCPYVRKHYDSNNMQTLQGEATADGVVWLTILSNAPGEQGNVSPAEANELTNSRGAKPTRVVLDPQGTIGHAYEAKTTPHMYIIDGTGKLVYMGGIDDKATADADDIPSSTNYVRTSLAELKDGKPISNPETRPYGCSIKYSS
jgi:hypothetical protein